MSRRPDRETLAGALWTWRHSVDGNLRCEKHTYGYSLAKDCVRCTADALLSGPLAQPPAPAGDGGMPDEVRKRAREAALTRDDELAEVPGRADTAVIWIEAVDAGAEVAYAAGRADERAAVAAWLRSHPGSRFVDGFPTFADVARLIEGGKHGD